MSENFVNIPSRCTFVEKMNTEIVFKDIVSVADSYYKAIKDSLKRAGYTESYIYEQRDKIHHALLWMIRDDLIVVDGDTHQGTANLVWSCSSQSLYFIHDDGNVDCVDWHEEGIDYFIGTNGKFAVHKYEWSDAMREIDEHEKEQEEDSY